MNNTTWLNITGIQEDFFNAFVNVFGDSTVVFLVVLCFLAFLCVAGRLRVEEGIIVMLPTLMGVIQDGWLPFWIKALIAIAIAFVWGMMLFRILREG